MTAGAASEHRRRVWVTRSEPQAGSLCEAVTAAGMNAVAVPVLSIQGPADAAAVRQRLQQELQQAQLAVFVSRNAVDWTWRLLAETVPERLHRITVCTVGPATAAELQARGIEAVIVPEHGSDSEALLALPQLQAGQIRERRVVILRGNGGRALLGDALQARGARTAYVEVYRRMPHPDTQARLPQLWQEQPPHAIVVSSPAGLQALIDMTGMDCQNQLFQCPLLAVGTGLAAQADRIGFRSCQPVAATAGDAGVVTALLEHFREDAHER